MSQSLILKRNEVDNWGFTQRNRETIFSVLSGCPSVKKVMLFGSRATGTHREYSDIDLVIMNPDVQRNQLLSLIAAFEESDLPFFVDLLLYNQLQNEDLKTEIISKGKLIYQLD